MRIIFTKSKLPLSVLIRWGLKEPVSHTAIVFDNKLVFHSNLLGLHINWLNTFKSQCDIVYSLDYDMPLEVEEMAYQKILNESDGKPYDYGAFFYFIYRAILWRIFGLAMPKNNRLAKNNAILCTEVVELVAHHLGLKIEKDLAITSPYQLYLALYDKK